LPVGYFLITFTLPAQFRSLAWRNQRTVYSCIMRCAWDTVRDFTQNDKQLNGDAGATLVLHTHTRALNYHPHVHLLMPAAAVNKTRRLWREKRSRGKKRYLFNHRALAKVFRAKMLEAITEAGLSLPKQHPTTWVVDCRSVGSGRKALIYLGRYLYRGVIQEKHIIASKDGKVTYRYQDSETNKRVFDLVMRFGTSKSPKRTRSSTTCYCPGRPGHWHCATTSQARCRSVVSSRDDLTPCSDAYFASPLARYAHVG
jgi:hypothetical protein